MVTNSPEETPNTAATSDDEKTKYLLNKQEGKDTSADSALARAMRLIWQKAMKGKKP